LPRGKVLFLLNFAIDPDYPIVNTVLSVTIFPDASGGIWPGAGMAPAEAMMKKTTEKSPFGGNRQPRGL
jgi:hypothetical protein